MRGRAVPPHPGIYQVPPHPRGQSTRSKPRVSQYKEFRKWSTALQTVRRYTEITQYLLTLSTRAWTPQSLTLVQLASTDLNQQHRAATCSKIDSPINSPPRHLLKFSSYPTRNQFNLSNLSAFFPVLTQVILVF